MSFRLDDIAAVGAFASLGIQSLSGCIEGFQLLTTALHLGKHAEYYRCALLLEEQRLLLWSKRSGLGDQKPDQRLPWHIINQVLGNLQNLLCSLEKLSKRYFFKVELQGTSQTGKTMEEYASLSGDDLSFLARGDIARERARILERAEKIQNKVGPVKKFWFAAVDKAKFGEFLQEISGHIEKLYALLSDRVQEELLEFTHLQRAQNVMLASKVDEIKSMVEANSLRNLIHLPESTAALLKFVDLTGRAGTSQHDIEHLLTQVTQPSHKSLQPIFPHRISDSRRSGALRNRGVVYYDEKRYFAEWKKYDWPETQDEKKRVQDSIVQLALVLNAPKHLSFRTLSCFGIVANERSLEYTFLYHWPTEGVVEYEPKTLHEYLSSSYKPSLSHRLQLAKQLANSLYLFHTANWMHKSLSSHSIIFFPSSASSRSLQDPYIVGFAYSRPDKKGEPSMKLERNQEADIYRHPNCFKEDYGGFHKAYDIYSLGLVLLEIAKWRPLRETFIKSARERNLSITKRDLKSMTKEEVQNLDKELAEKCHEDDISHMRQILLDHSVRDSYAVDVAFRAGSAYCDAAYSCIGEEFISFWEEKNDVALLSKFYDKVLKPLNSSEI